MKHLLDVIRSTGLLKLCCAGDWKVVGSIPQKGHFQYIYFFSISSFFFLKHKIYLNLLSRISTRYCLYDALRKMPISANSELTVGQLSIGTGSNNVFSLPSLYISLRASKVVTVIGQFRFCQNHSGFSDFPRVTINWMKALCCLMLKNNQQVFLSRTDSSSARKLQTCRAILGGWAELQFWGE